MTPGPGPWAARTDGRRYLSSERHFRLVVGEYLWCRRFTSLQQTRLVSLDADHSRRSQNAPCVGNDFITGAVSRQLLAFSFSFSTRIQHRRRKDSSLAPGPVD